MKKDKTQIAKADMWDRPDTPLRRSIKIVGVGKHGSKDLPDDLIDAVTDELRSGSVPPALQGAFWGALIIKGLTQAERALAKALPDGVLEEPKQLAAHLAPETPLSVQSIAAGLLNGETLDYATARRLGDFLFSDVPGDGLRGMAASILRIRYETPTEYAALLDAAQATLSPGFQTPPAAGDPIVQLAEPFDGVDHSYLLTPVLAEFIQQQGFRVVSCYGRNSGPKQGITLDDLVRPLDLPRTRANAALGMDKPLAGWYIHQQDMSPAVDRWVDLRRQIIKRPFLATLEKFLNPSRATIVIASAFHPAYGEKMQSIAETAGFPGVIIARNGVEGTLGFAPERPARLLCSARRADGSYQQHTIVCPPDSDATRENVRRLRIEHPDAAVNTGLLQRYQNEKTTGITAVDRQIRRTCDGLRLGLRWVMNAMEGEK